MSDTQTSFAAQYQPRFEWRFLMPQHWPAWLMVGLMATLLLCPVAIKRRIARGLASRILARNRKRRHIVDVNLSLCFSAKNKDERRVMAEAFFYYAARVLLDYGLLWFASKRKLAQSIEIQGEAVLAQAQAANKQIILLTCHSLALEYGALAVTQEHATVGLIKPARNALFEWLIARGRSRFQGRLIERNAGIRHIVRAVKQGMMFYYLPDEDLGGSQQTAFVPFFGVPTATLTSLGRLARLCDAVVVPCFSWLDESRGKYVLSFYPALEDFPGEDEVADASRMNQVLEQMIGSAPEQYLWSFRIFQTRPDGVPNPYAQND